MLEGISQIKEKVHSSKYLPRSTAHSFDIQGTFDELRVDSRFSKFSDEELYEYVFGLKEKLIANLYKADCQSMGFNTSKPSDPFWGQFTYEEILEMVNDGVTVPQEFIDWANTMQDSDTTSYQIETASDDPNAYENLAANTSNSNSTEVQKRAQAFSSKAQAQEELVKNKCDEIKPVANQVKAEKNELEANQKLSLQKMDSMTREWNALDKKFKSGEELTEAEQKKYKELGLMLSDDNNGLKVQAEKVSGDIDELMGEIENIDMLLDINKRINAEIEDVGTRLAAYEANKNHVVIKSGNQVTGINAAIYVAAMSNNLAIDTGISGISLFINTREAEQSLNTNVSLANTTSEKAAQADQQNKKANNTQAQEKTSANETTAEEEVSPAAEIDDTAETTETTETSASAETSVETEDPLKAQTEQLVSECESRNNTMAMAEQEIQAKSEKIKNLKKTQKQDDAKLNNELKKNLDEYDKLANKSASGETLTDDEEKRVKTLEKTLNAKNGTLITEMKQKAETLTGFAAELESDIQTTSDNIQFGNEAIEKGKAYAIQELGDRSHLLYMPWGRSLSQEEVKDILYGKSGESLGRDAIDNGELLMNNAKASNSKLSKSLPLAAFAEDYGAELNKKASSTTKQVKSIENNLKNGNAANSASVEGSNETSKKKNDKEDKDVTKEDGQTIEKKGKTAKKDGENAKKDGEEAKKEKKSTEKQIKATLNNLKNSEARIQKYAADTTETNAKMMAKTTELEAMAEAQEQNPESAQPQANNKTSLNNTANSPQPMQLNASAGTPSDGNSEIMSKVSEIESEAPQVQTKVDSNTQNIQKLQKTSATEVKKLTKLYTQKTKEQEALQKSQEAAVQANSETQEVVSDVNDKFDKTQKAGQLLMMVPWTHGIGLFMVNLGTYGMQVCKVASTVLTIASGNFLGAIVQVGAAALTYTQGADKMVPAGAAVQTAALDGLKDSATGGLQNMLSGGVQSLTSGFSDKIQQQAGKLVNKAVDKLVDVAVDKASGVIGGFAEKLGLPADIANSMVALGTSAASGQNIGAALGNMAKESAIGIGSKLAGDALGLPPELFQQAAAVGSNFNQEGFTSQLAEFGKNAAITVGSTYGAQALGLPPELLQQAAAVGMDYKNPDFKQQLAAFGKDAALTVGTQKLNDALGITAQSMNTSMNLVASFKEGGVAALYDPKAAKKKQAANNDAASVIENAVNKSIQDIKGVQDGEKKLEQLENQPQPTEATAPTDATEATESTDATSSTEATASTEPTEATSGTGAIYQDEKGHYFVHNTMVTKEEYEAAKNMDEKVVNAGFFPGASGDVYIEDQDDPITFTVTDGKYLVDGKEVDAATFMSEYNSALEKSEDSAQVNRQNIRGMFKEEDYSKYQAPAASENVQAASDEANEVKPVAAHNNENKPSEKKEESKEEKKELITSNTSSQNNTDPVEKARQDIRNMKPGDTVQCGADTYTMDKDGTIRVNGTAGEYTNVDEAADNAEQSVRTKIEADKRDKEEDAVLEAYLREKRNKQGSKRLSAFETKEDRKEKESKVEASSKSDNNNKKKKKK